MVENALGKASSDSSSADKELSCSECGDVFASKTTLSRHRRNFHPENLDHKCLSCDKVFETSVAMKSHHKQKHGESIAGVDVECSYCASEFTVSKSEKHEGHMYCSKECQSKGRSERYSGEGHPRWNGGKETLECEHCDSDYKVVAAKKETSRFCSRDCHHSWRSENERGENHRIWNRLECECEICGETVYRQPSQFERMDHVFCSQEHHREYQSRHQVGENHHNYSGGRAKEYGPNWHKQRRKCIKRDRATCQRCSSHGSDFDCSIHVHHRTPRKQFMGGGELDHQAANDLSNLVCLCPACHKTVERWGLAVQI